MNFELVGTRRLIARIPIAELDSLVGHSNIQIPNTIVTPGFIDRVLEEAYQETGFHTGGPFSLTLKTTNNLIILDIEKAKSWDDMFNSNNQANSRPAEEEWEDDKEVHDDYTPITLRFTYRFKDFEDLLSACKLYIKQGFNKGNIYHYNGDYYLVVKILTTRRGSRALDTFTSISTEYGEKSDITMAVLTVYGKPILLNNGIEALVEKF